MQLTDENPAPAREKRSVRGDMRLESDSRIEGLLTIAALAVLVIGCFLILQPFLTACLWAIVLCYSTWPLYLRLDRQLRGLRTVTAIIMTTMVAIVLVLPFALVGPRLAEDGSIVVGQVAEILREGPPAPPAWIKDLPVVGPDAATYWDSLAHDSAKFAEAASQYVTPLRNWLLQEGVAFGQGVIELCLSIFIAFFIYRDGAAMGPRVAAATRRFAGARAKPLIETAGATTRGVVYGILGTALLQGALAGIGLYLAGVSAALFLGLLTFFLSLIPMGPPLVWLPASLLLLNRGDMGAGIFMFLWGLIVVTGVESVLRPYFISREGKLPFLLVFLGVLGGIATFGFIGLFLGPVFLSVGFSLVKEWSAHDPESPA
jgi:predicted PurR-regulated permease PerM